MKTHLFLVVVAAACSSKTDESKSSGASAGASGSGAGQAQTPGAKRALDCDQVFPQGMRARYTAGAEVKNVKKLVSDNGGCGFKVGDKDVNIDVLCDDSSWAEQDASLQILHQMGSGYQVKDLAIGKGGARLDHDVAQQVTVWDDNSNCVVTLNLSPPGGFDLEALAKDLVAALPPAGRSTATPAAHGPCKLTGSCSRCTNSKDCTGGETCITYQSGANHYSGCVDGRTCSVGQIMVQGDALCGTKNKMD
jgi:hypothetical protein